MKLFWGDYHKATRHLRRDQHGAYFLLIGEAWRLGGSLPDDDAMLAAWALCTPDEWRETKPVIMAFFALRRGKWVHDRVREELASYETTSRKRKEAGRRGGSASRGKGEGNSEAIARLKPTKPEPEPESIEEPPNPLGGDGQFHLLPGEPEPVDDVTQAFHLWNNMAGRCGLPIAADLTDARRRSIGKRLERGGLKAWRIAMDAVEASAFCRGQVPGKDGGKPFTAHLDFVCQASSFQKLIEGFYGRDAKAVEAPRPAADPDDVWRRRVKAWQSGSRYWNTNDWEAAPGKPGCIVPIRILAEFNIVAPLAEATEERAA